MSARRTITARIGLLVASAIVTGPALAQVPPAPTKAVEAPTPPARPKGKPRVIEIDAVTVEGEVQKPEAFYILQRSELNFKGLEPARSFIPLIIESVEKEPF